MALKPSAPPRVSAGVVSDEDLFRRVVEEDDSSAFAQLVERYKRRLMGFLVRMLSDEGVAEDCLQDTFLRIYRERKRFRLDHSFSTWMFTIAANLAKSELRRRSRWRFVGLDMVLDRPTPGPQPEAAAEHKELGRILEDAIGTLPTVFREAFLLRDVESLSYEEIAWATASPLGTVKSRVNRARLLLQESLRAYRETAI
jgi:RNA polymerase sigma-70 factor (ECF subfamily)